MDYRQPDLSVITVNYNGFHDTCEFIDSWTATIFSVSYEMIVIDNGSTANYKPQNKMFHFCKTFCSKITLVNTIQNVI